MEQIILTPDQKQLLHAFSLHPELQKQFYLSGGTALSAYYLKHRKSDDLDFFTHKTVDLATVTEFTKHIKEKLGAKHVSYERLYDRNIFIFSTNPTLKVEFTRYPFPHLEPLVEKNGVLIDSLYDIAVNKLFALFDRNEPKDFVDLYFLLKRFILKKLVTGVTKKFDMTISALTLGSELLKVRHITMMPRMILPLIREDLVAFFEKHASALKKDILL